jgi:hypothetical protein
LFHNHLPIVRGIIKGNIERLNDENDWFNVTFRTGKDQPVEENKSEEIDLEQM